MALAAAFGAFMWTGREIRAGLARLGVPGLLAVAVTLLGLGLRIEHALTFDGPARGSDYAVHIEGVRWILDHHRIFNFDDAISDGARYQPPLWYALGAVILRVTHSERAIAGIAVIGWLIRQLVLARLLRLAIPGRRWSALAALAINAVLPLSVLVDGKVNPEGLQATLFMTGAYALWLMEREAGEPTGISLRTAVLFGATAGLALLTKATSAALPIAAFIVVGARGARVVAQAGWQAAGRLIVRPALVAALAWTVVAGWWCGHNLWKYKHPFPHVWVLSQTSEDQGAEPVAYRRSLGWLLPLEWRPVLKLPVIVSPTEPRPNFWATNVVGTWSDVYNRGFCRLKRGGTTDQVWGGWPVSTQCVHLFQALVAVGLCLTVSTVIAVALTLRNHARTAGRRGSLALPTVVVMVVFFVMLFALTYPYDGCAVTNPRYLLSTATPMAACLGIALGQLEVSRRVRITLHALVLLCIAAVGLLVVVERAGG